MRRRIGLDRLIGLGGRGGAAYLAEGKGVPVRQEAMVGEGKDEKEGRKRVNPK